MHLSFPIDCITIHNRSFVTVLCLLCDTDGRSHMLFLPKQGLWMLSVVQTALHSWNMTGKVAYSSQMIFLYQP